MDKVMENNYKSIAVSGYYGFDNFGDEAILDVLAKELKANNFHVTVFSKSPEKTGLRLGVNSVYTFDIKKVVNTLKDVDVLISGGGSLLQDSTSLKSLLYYLFVIYNALRYKKKVIIFAQGIGPIKNPIGRFITKMLLKKCTYITVRDEKSLFRLRGWDLKPDLVSDPVWNLAVKEKLPMNRVGVQLRSWKGLSQKYLFALARQISANFADKEIYIYSFQDALDLELCKHFEAQLKLVNPDIKTTLLNSLTIDQTVQSFSNLDYLIGMRYHACLLALKYGIPTLALSYDEKVDKIAKRFDLPCSNLEDADKFDELFNELKNLQTSKIMDKVKACRFDFTNILKAINE